MLALIAEGMSNQAIAARLFGGVLKRDGQVLSATATRLRNLSNADHLAILHAIWTRFEEPHMVCRTLAI